MSTQVSQQTRPLLAGFYGDEFYTSYMEGSLRSAIKYAHFLTTIYKPNSVADIGCGRGTWLKAFKDKGVSKVVGYDGTWNHQDNMIEKSTVFHGVDLNSPISTPNKERYDLAMSLEVAEHLEASSAATFISSLTELSDTVLFGAAYTKQGGTNHINEQPHSYWAKLFASHGYSPYDLFRPIFWGDDDIEFWYQQNTFLYVKKDTSVAKLLSDAGYQPLANIDFMDCIHPILYNSKLEQISTKALIRRLVLNMRRLVVKTVPPPLRPFARKLEKALKLRNRSPRRRLARSSSGS
jgi:hypothetical protein